MMKKLLATSATAVGLMLSAQAYAAPIAITGTADVWPVGEPNGHDCAALDNNITVQLSKNVHGSFGCDNTNFEAATCHEAGTNKTQTVTCSWNTITDPLGGPDTYVPNVTGCGTDPNAGVTSATYTGRTAYFGNSSGGRVGPNEFLQTVCDATTIVTMTPNY